MKFQHHRFFSVAASTLLTAAILFSVGCGSEKQLVTLDPEYSWNLTKIDEEWPDKKGGKLDLKDSEIKVYEKYGRPDSIRILYDRQRSVFTKMEVDTKFIGRDAKTIDDFDHSWVYYMREMEIVFHPSGSYEVLPLSDKIKILYEYGDPNSRKTHPTRTEEETWTYYQMGKRFKFSGDDQIDEESFTRMGRFRRN